MHGDKCLPNELSFRILMPYCQSKGHTTDPKAFLGTYFRGLQNIFYRQPFDGVGQ